MQQNLCKELSLNGLMVTPKDDLLIQARTNPKQMSCCVRLVRFKSVLGLRLYLVVDPIT